MINRDQLNELVKKYRTNETTIAREYLQHIFLSVFYQIPNSNGVIFKGGTALHLIFGAPRFSEDLDFTVNLAEENFLKLIGVVFKKVEAFGDISYKERETFAGRRFLLTARLPVLRFPTFINLDFSFREKSVLFEKTTIKTEYPILYKSYVYHYSKEEIFAEIRAILTREKGRDIYDLWYLLNIGVNVDPMLVTDKVKYYDLENIQKKDILTRINNFSEKKFIEDLRPFVAEQERNRLGELFRFITDYLANNLPEIKNSGKGTK